MSFYKTRYAIFKSMSFKCLVCHLRVPDTEKEVSGTGKEFHSVSENEAPDMNVHSLAGRAMENERVQPV